MPNSNCRLAALGFARSQLGVTEHPPDSNSGPQVDIYLKSTGLGPGFPWCMAFIHWCFKQAGVILGGSASVGNFETWAKRNGEIVSRPLVGDVVCYNFTADNWPDHVGIVEKGSLAMRWGKRSLGWIHTIEGNTSVGNDANGGTVMRRYRWSNRCVFVRIHK